MTIHSLKDLICGTVIVPADGDYENARQRLVWNGRKPDRFPAAIVRATSVADVQATVRFAAENGLTVSPRGGGHHWSGIAVQDGIVLDLSALNSVSIDAEARVAEVGPTVRNADLARALGEKGLAFPVGHCATVPVSGYLLGGGFGWNAGAWGIACFSVIGLDVVTADGELRRVSETHNPEIFWAARGAGPEFFGVVVRYRLRLQLLPRAITTSVFTYPLSEIAAVERWMSGAVASLPHNVEFTVMMSSAPPPLAGSVAKVATGIATVFADSQEEARETLSAIAASAPAGALHVEEMIPTPFDVLYGIMGQFFPEGRRYAVDTFWGGADAGSFLSTLATSTARAPSPETFSIGVVIPPPPPGAPGLPDAAFSMVGGVFGCSYAIWQDPAQDGANRAWLRSTGEALASGTVGHYLGEADLDQPEHARNSFSPAAWARLTALQAKYDPDGIFRAHRRSNTRLSPAA